MRIHDKIKEIENYLSELASIVPKQDAKGMRNIIAHQYGSIDDKVVFESITKELARVVRAFVQNFRTLK